MFDIVIKECSNLDSIITLFNEHRNDPFTYLADTHLFRMFSRSKRFRAFVAEVDDQAVGCIYALKYMYDCGWFGGLLVHKRFRRMGIGRRLLEKALGFLGHGPVFTFVEPENVAAKSLFENVGFNAVYRRLNCVTQIPFNESRSKYRDISYDVEWDDFTTSLGFEERGSIVSIGYYPVKVTKYVFEDLKNRRRILKCGRILAIVENSYNIDANGYTFTFNDYILKPPKKKIAVVEVNPFYTKSQVVDLIKLINHLTADGKVAIWTYQGDPIIRGLPSKGTLGALVMEL